MDKQGLDERSNGEQHPAIDGLDLCDRFNRQEHPAVDKQGLDEGSSGLPHTAVDARDPGEISRGGLHPTGNGECIRGEMFSGGLHAAWMNTTRVEGLAEYNELTSPR